MSENINYAIYNAMPLHEGDKVVVKAITVKKSFFGDTLLPVTDSRYNSDMKSGLGDVFIRGEVAAVSKVGSVTIKYDKDWLSKLGNRFFSTKLYNDKDTCEVSYIVVSMLWGNGLWRIKDESPSNGKVLPTRIDTVKDESRVSHTSSECDVIYEKAFPVESEQSTRITLPNGDVVYEAVKGAVEVKLYKNKKDGFVSLHIGGRIFDWTGACQKVMAQYIHSGKMTEILRVWNRWNNNDEFVGCEHQHEYEFSDKPEDYIGQVCPICGHEFGSKWMREKLPQEIIDKVKSW